jgi:hypothetical protein
MTLSLIDDAEYEALRRFYDRELAEIGIEPAAVAELIDGGADNLLALFADMLAQLATDDPLALPADLGLGAGEALLG